MQKEPKQSVFILNGVLGLLLLYRLAAHHVGWF